MKGGIEAAKRRDLETAVNAFRSVLGESFPDWNSLVSTYGCKLITYHHASGAHWSDLHRGGIMAGIAVSAVAAELYPDLVRHAQAAAETEDDTGDMGDYSLEKKRTYDEYRTGTKHIRELAATGGSKAYVQPG